MNLTGRREPPSRYPCPPLTGQASAVPIPDDSHTLARLLSGRLLLPWRRLRHGRAPAEPAPAKPKTALEKEIEAQLSLLRENNTLLNHLLKTGTHDLRNPLTTILTMTELQLDRMRTGAVGPEEQETVLRMIHEAGKRMSAIINEFLDYQRAVSEACANPPTPFSIPEAVSAAAGPLQFAATQKAMTLTVDCPPDLPRGLGDAERFAQALANYIGNAIKFSPRGAAITIRGLRRGGHIRIEVSDPGPGVPPAERGRLFHEFPRISNRPTAGEPSTGLGLSIVRRLIEAQGGRVGADFPESGGAAFWLEIPAAPALRETATPLPTCGNNHEALTSREAAKSSGPDKRQTEPSFVIARSASSSGEAI